VALAMAALGVAPATALADPDTSALRGAVNRAEVLRYEQRLQTIALANENNRLTASAGNLESVDYVIGKLREYGYNPTLLPYTNASNPNSWSEKTASVLEQVSPTPKSYVSGTTATSDFAAMTWSLSGDTTARIVPAKRIQIPPPATANTVRSGCSMDDFPPEVKDNIVLVQRGGCTELVKVINARANGAKAILIFNEGQSGRTASARFTSQTYPGLQAAGLSYATGVELYNAAQEGPVTVRLKTDVNRNSRIDYDILATTEGGDPTRVLQVGAHIDGVSAGPGINDDGSGTSMILAIAHQLKVNNMTPKYQIRFGWFSGEEQGLYGSQYAVNQLNSRETAQTLAMLDYDMLASTNWLPFVYTDGATIPSAETILGANHIDYLKDHLNITSTPYIFDNRSDYAGWRNRGVPATGLYTGAETVKSAAQVAAYGGQSGIQADPCYHEWCDTVFNLSEFGMNEFTDALAHSIWSFAGPGAIELPVREDT